MGAQYTLECEGRLRQTNLGSETPPKRHSKCISSDRDAKTMEVPDNHPGCSAPLPFYSDSDSLHSINPLWLAVAFLSTVPILSTSSSINQSTTTSTSHQSTISVGAQYTLETTIVLQVRYHRNDIVFSDSKDP